MYSELSIFFARTLSIVYLTFGIGFLFNSEYYKKRMEEILNDFGLVMSWGLIAMVIGYMVIFYHNIWERDWPALVTLVGYVLFIEGSLFICFPKILGISKLFLKMPHFMKLSGIAALVAGCVFGYFGFFVK